MDLSKLSDQLGKFQGMKQDLPPVQDWNPELSGDMDMIIKADGRWVHEGDEITREKLVRIFSTILKREGNEYFLVTPVEKWRIQVEDSAFQVVLAQYENGSLKMITNVGDEIVLGAVNTMALGDDELPQVNVRNGLMAKLNRNVYYQLAEQAMERGGDFYIQSNGEEFLLAKG